MIFLLFLHESLTETCPVASLPAAIPAKVPSVILGNTLLVPVEIGSIGTDPQPFATTRLVPSPPSVTIQPTFKSFIIFAAFVVPD